MVRACRLHVALAGAMAIVALGILVQSSPSVAFAWLFGLATRELVRGMVGSSNRLTGMGLRRTTAVLLSYAFFVAGAMLTLSSPRAVLTWLFGLAAGAVYLRSADRLGAGRIGSGCGG